MIFDELCEKLRFEVNYAKSQHLRISEALILLLLRMSANAYAYVLVKTSLNTGLEINACKFAKCELF